MQDHQNCKENYESSHLSCSPSAQKENIFSENSKLQNSEGLQTPLKNNQKAKRSKVNESKIKDPSYAPIEKRLTEIKKVYEAKREQANQNYRQKEMQEVTGIPKINPNSQRIVDQKMTDSTSPFRVISKPQKIEDRLLEQHKISQKEHEEKIRQEEQKIKDMARPSIGDKSNGSIQTFLSKKLNEYIKKAEHSKQVLEEKYTDKDCTFKPRINKTKNQLGEEHEGNNDLSRQGRRRFLDKPKYKSKVNTDEN